MSRAARQAERDLWAIEARREATAGLATGSGSTVSFETVARRPSWLSRLARWIDRTADHLEASEAEAQRRAVEIAQQRTAVMIARREARQRQRDFADGHLDVKGYPR